MEAKAFWDIKTWITSTLPFCPFLEISSQEQNEHEWTSVNLYKFFRPLIYEVS